jgi:DNA processing protein
MAVEQLRNWLILNRAPGLGPIRLHRLLQAFPDVQSILEASASTLRQAGLPTPAIEALRSPDEAAIKADLSWADQPDAQLIPLDSEDYPSQLREIADPPVLLYVLGDSAALHSPQLAVVGSRNPTPVGTETATRFAAYLAQTGLGITSGLASGIDAAAHQGALSGNGRTVAVMGTGLDRVYPARHRDLAHAIAEQGALVSEFPLGSGPRRGHFPRRNRIISGLAQGVLVVEAAIHSGSLITAQQALEQGREVFAVPGSIHNPNSKGCHKLLREGAKLVETAEDILEELGGWYAEPSAVSQNFAPGGEIRLDRDYVLVLENVGDGPTTVDEVVSRTGLTADAVCSMLLVLELQGFICTTAAGHYCQTGKRTIHEREHTGRLDVSV